MSVTDCLLKCLVYRRGGKEGQFIKVNYHIQSRHGIMNSTAWVAYRAHGEYSNPETSAWNVTDCHRLLIVLIVLQSAPIVSAADVLPISVKL